MIQLIQIGKRGTNPTRSISSCYACGLYAEGENNGTI